MEADHIFTCEHWSTIPKGGAVLYMRVLRKDESGNEHWAKVTGCENCITAALASIPGFREGEGDVVVGEATKA